MNKELLDELLIGFEGDIEHDEETLREYSFDTSIFEIQPDIVVFPKHTKDVQVLVRFANQHKGVSLTPRSAGTDMTGGPLNTSIIVDMTRYFTKISEVVGDSVTTEPGVFYRYFEKHTLASGKLLPCYTASRELNTVGGMVGNNSGGEKSLKYGKTERYIEKLDVVLSDGEVYEFKKLNKNELNQKLEQQDFEGELYRSVWEMIQKNEQILGEAKPRVSKNSAGYYLWNIYNKETDTFDMTQLFVGSQGTLGIITSIEFSLVTPEPKSRMLVMFMRNKDMPQLGHIVKDVLEYQPESFEAYDDHTFGILLKVFPSMMKRLGGNIFSLGWKFLPDMKAIIFGGIPKLVLMAEFTGQNKKEIDSQIQAAQEKVVQYGLRTHITRSKSDSEKYWTIRRESFALLRKHVHGKKTAPFIDDVVVEPAKLPEFIPRLYKVMDEFDITYTIAGHVGDGNFHIIPLMDFTRPDFAKIIYELSEKVYSLVLEYGGSITGEHNDGIIRTPYLEQMYGKEIVNLFAQTKQLLDPETIFNPGKKVGIGREEIGKYIKK